MKVSIVIPLYNEEENIAILHQRLKETLERIGCGYEIIYVDDGSADRTLAGLEEIQAEDKKVVVSA